MVVKWLGEEIMVYHWGQNSMHFRKLNVELRKLECCILGPCIFQSTSSGTSTDASIATRSTLDRQATDPLSTESRPLFGRASTDMSTDSMASVVGRYLADIDGRHWSTEFRPTYRARLGRYVQHNAVI